MRHNRHNRNIFDALGEEPETAVLFRRWRVGGDVLALFPLLPGTRLGTCGSYSHVGQHGVANLCGVVRLTRPANPGDEDVRSLRAELERIGYRVRPIKRSPHWGSIRAARLAAGL